MILVKELRPMASDIVIKQAIVAEQYFDNCASFQIIEKEGLDVAFGVVFIDREQGGKRRIEHLVGKKVYRLDDRVSFVL